MAKKINKKLAVKKETLRSLSEAELDSVAGGTLYVSSGCYSVIVPPPPVTLGCDPGTILVIKYY